MFAPFSANGRAKMSTYQLRKNGFWRGSIAVMGGVLFLLSGYGSVAAQERPTESQILHALTPPPVTRALTDTPSPSDVKRRALIKNLRSTARTRSLTGDERDQLAEVTKDRPSIDLEIYFDYNSSKISSKAIPDLENLGRALGNETLKGGVYLIGGHTDAKGGTEYNQGLSERRAQAVKNFLVDRFRLGDDTLVSAGYGKGQLKNTANPFAAENRRVKITNLETKQEAAK